jgi:hypothetical protein
LAAIQLVNQALRPGQAILESARRTTAQCTTFVMQMVARIALRDRPTRARLGALQLSVQEEDDLQVRNIQQTPQVPIRYRRARLRNAAFPVEPRPKIPPARWSSRKVRHTYKDRRPESGLALICLEAKPRTRVSS